VLCGLKNEDLNGKTGKVVGATHKNRIGVLIQGDIEAKSFKSKNLGVCREVMLEDDDEVIFE
jgi:hypothetical protein